LESHYSIEKIGRKYWEEAQLLDLVSRHFGVFLVNDCPKSKLNSGYLFCKQQCEKFKIKFSEIMCEEKPNTSRAQIFSEKLELNKFKEFKKLVDRILIQTSSTEGNIVHVPHNVLASYLDIKFDIIINEGWLIIEVELPGICEIKWNFIQNILLLNWKKPKKFGHTSFHKAFIPLPLESFPDKNNAKKSYIEGILQINIPLTNNNFK